MLADELKEQTRLVHADLEKKLLTHIQGVKDTGRYTRLLVLMYGYYAALEQQLDRFRQDLPDYNIRRKSQAILDDLDVLAYPTKQIPVCLDVPSIHSLPSALGAMYVLEGSTLGGKIISKMLLKQVPTLEGSTRFFQGYKEESMTMWQKFKEHLHSTVDESQQHETHFAAKETFVKFKKWLEYHDAN
ncbi:MAG TPA: biliverdin-producing heme oxygenase [Chryseosolibacter sp.]